MLVAKGHDVIVLDNPEPQVCTGELLRHKNNHAKYMLGNIRHRKYRLKAANDIIPQCKNVRNLPFV